MRGGAAEGGLIGGAGPLAIPSFSFLTRLVSPALACSGTERPSSLQSSRVHQSVSKVKSSQSVAV